MARPRRTLIAAALLAPLACGRTDRAPLEPPPRRYSYVAHPEAVRAEGGLVPGDPTSVLAGATDLPATREGAEAVFTVPSDARGGLLALLARPGARFRTAGGPAAEEEDGRGGVVPETGFALIDPPAPATLRVSDPDARLVRATRRARLLLEGVRPDRHPALCRLDLAGARRPAFVASVPGALEFRLPEGHAEGRFEAWLDAPFRGEHPVEVRVLLDGLSVLELRIGRRGALPLSLAVAPAGRVVRLEARPLEEGTARRAVLAVAAPAYRPASRDLRPDLVLVSLDTVRADRTALERAGDDPTPALAALAARGAVFRRAVAPSAWTLPSHATIFSGLLPDRHGVVRKDHSLPDDLPLLAEELLAAGYETAAFTGGGFVDPRFGFDRGFERYGAVDPAGPPPSWAQTRPDDLREAALAMARRSAEERARLLAWASRPHGAPRFLFVHTYAAHEYRADPDAIRARGGTATSLREALQAAGLRRGADPHALDEETRRRLVRDLEALYDASLAVADRLLADLLAALHRSGRFDDTLVVVLSDHGEELFDHGEFGHEKSLYEEILRVPLVFAGPGVPPVTIEDVVSLADVAPTLRRLLGLPPVSCDGRDLTPLFRGRSLRPEAALARADRKGRTIRALRGRRLKLMEWTEEGEEPIPRLFDLDADPAERNDLAAARPQDVRRMIEALARRLERLQAEGIFRAPDLRPDPSLRRDLRALGYLGGD